MPRHIARNWRKLITRLPTWYWGLSQAFENSLGLTDLLGYETRRHVTAIVLYVSVSSVEMVLAGLYYHSLRMKTGGRESSSRSQFEVTAIETKVSLS